MRKTSIAKNVVPHYLDNNNTIKLIEFSRADTHFFLIILNNKNNEPLFKKVDKDLIFGLKSNITDYAEEIDNHLSLNRDASVSEVENLQAYKHMITDSRAIIQELFGSNYGFFKNFINEAKTVSRIDYQSEEFTLPLEFISYGDTKFHLLGELSTIYRKFLKEGIVGEEDGKNIENVKLSYLPTKDIDEGKVELLYFESLSKDNSKNFDFNLITDVENSKDFFSHKKVADSNFIHLSCHIKIDKNNVLKTYLNFEKFEFSLSDFLLKENQEQLRGKIMFINGCSLLKNRYNPSKINIYSRFFEGGLSLLIACGSDVYDDLAIEFTKDFYDNFLKNKNTKTVQEIIQQIAKEKWQTNRNPIGFFYHTIGPIFTN